MTEPLAPPAATPTPAAPAAPASAAVVNPVPEGLQPPAPAAPAPKPGSDSVLDAAKDPNAPKPADSPTPAAPVVPEKYEFKAPEGMELDQKLVDSFSPLAKEFKLSQEQAQKLVDLHATTVQSIQKAQDENYQQFLADQKAETLKALGAKADEELAFAAKARDRFFPKELAEVFNATGLSNNLHFVKAMIAIGKQISEGKLVEGGDKNPMGSDLRTIYPSMENA